MYKSDITDYQLSLEVLEQLKSVTLLAVVGPTAAGKTTIVNLLAREVREVQVVPSYTNRPPRKGEISGRDRVFLTDAELRELISKREFVQIQPSPKSDIYGTIINSYPKNGVAAMDIWASAINSFRKLPFKKMLTTYIIPISYEVWKKRFDNRELSPERRKERWQEAEYSINRALEDSDVHFILNDDLEDAVAQVKQLLNGKVDKQRETAARRTAESIYQQLV